MPKVYSFATLDQFYNYIASSDFSFKQLDFIWCNSLQEVGYILVYLLQDKTVILSTDI